MKKIGIIILTALALMGGCKTKEKVQKPKDGTVATDTIALQDSTAITTEIPESGVETTQSEDLEEPVVPKENTTGEPIVAHINTVEILATMPETAKAEEALTAYGQEVETQIKAMLEEYQKKVEEFESQQDSLSDLMKKTKENEILDLQNRIQMFQENAEKEFASKQTALYAPIREKLQKAMRVVTLEQGYTYMLDITSGAIVYIGDDAIDATPLVKKKLGLK
ncbi:MAG: OmpH family outer membrane protein [Bacteroidales bacterium]|nr:OmpH family outer membrane protein [Bacteroidales bacterium]